MFVYTQQLRKQKQPPPVHKIKREMPLLHITQSSETQGQITEYPRREERILSSLKAEMWSPDKKKINSLEISHTPKYCFNIKINLGGQEMDIKALKLTPKEMFEKAEMSALPKITKSGNKH